MDLAPIDLAQPYTYSLRVDGLAVAAGTGDANPLLFTYTFADTGTHVVEAIVANCGMGPGEGVTDTAHVVVHQPTVYYYVYLPIIHRNP